MENGGKGIRRWLWDVEKTTVGDFVRQPHHLTTGYLLHLISSHLHGFTV